MMTMTMEREIVDKYLGTPFKWAGRQPGVNGGMDCWTLVAAIMHDLGHTIWELDGELYPAGPDVDHNHFIENYHRQWSQVVTPQPFDVVLMRGLNGKASHAGVALSGHKMIHCPKAGVIISSMTETHWFRRIIGFYRLKVAA